MKNDLVTWIELWLDPKREKPYVIIDCPVIEPSDPWLVRYWTRQLIGQFPFVFLSFLPPANRTLPRENQNL